MGSFSGFLEQEKGAHERENDSETIVSQWIYNLTFIRHQVESEETQIIKLLTKPLRELKV